MNKIIKSVIDFQKTLQNFPEVRYAGDTVLRKVAEEAAIKEGVVIGKQLGEVLIRYRTEVGYGRGFAAPQIGMSKAIFVTFVDDQLQLFINPKITKRSKTTNFYKELCLSSGVMSADTERSEWIIMEWFDEKGEHHSKKFDGFLARLYQHEEAHLRGILNIDEACEGGIEFAIFDPLKEKLRKRR
jgi:peptide deformylase